MMTGLRREFAERWPVLNDVPWVPAIGDGAASNVGSGCTTTRRVALNVGTSGAMRICWEADSVKIQTGLWCYMADQRHFVMGGALSNAGDVFAWCQRNLRIEQHEIDNELGIMQPDEHGLTVLPFFSGERSTGWADYARATFTGMSLGTRPLDILRASLESVAYRFAAIYDLLRDELPPDACVIASGGGILASKVWTQMMADVIGVPVIASTAPEASSRGAALLTMQVLGLIKELDEIPAPLGTTFDARPNFREAYSRAQQRQQRLYDVLIKPGPGVLQS